MCCFQTSNFIQLIKVHTCWSAVFYPHIPPHGRETSLWLNQDHSPVSFSIAIENMAPIDT